MAMADVGSRPACCARAASGHAAAPPTMPRKPRRFMAKPRPQEAVSYPLKSAFGKGRWHGFAAMNAAGYTLNS